MNESDGNLTATSTLIHDGGGDSDRRSKPRDDQISIVLGGGNGIQAVPC